MKVNGRCHCGRITYEAIVDPERSTICHCSDCQMFSGSSYRAAVPAPRESFELKGELPTLYTKTADSGAKRIHAFCPHCGTPIYSCAAVDAPPFYTLRVGCLAQRAQLRPTRQMWCASALPWSADLREISRTERQ